MTMELIMVLRGQYPAGDDMQVRLDDLSKQTKTVDIGNIGAEIDKILKGGQVGRVVIKHGD